MHVRPTNARTQNFFLTRSLHHQHVSIAFATIFRVNDKNIRNPNSLSKHISKPLDVTRNVSNFLHSHIPYISCNQLNQLPSSELDFIPTVLVSRTAGMKSSSVTTTWP